MQNSQHHYSQISNTARNYHNHTSGSNRRESHHQSDHSLNLGGYGCEEMLSMIFTKHDLGGISLKNGPKEKSF